MCNNDNVTFMSTIYVRTYFLDIYCPKYVKHLKKFCIQSDNKIIGVS